MHDPIADPTYPRLLYRGAEDDTAETCRAADADGGAIALAAGWRLHRTRDAAAPSPAKADDKKPAAKGKS